MAKFIDVKEAAARVGVTPEELNEMRDRGEIHGYRDGATWKFKEDEVRRVIDERASGGGGSSSALGAFGIDDDIKLADDEANIDLDSVLVSEEELGHSGESTSSTIIGKSAEKVAKPDSDLQLQDEGSKLALVPEATKTDMKLVIGGDAESDLLLAPESDSDSDVTLVPSSAGPGDSDVSLIPTGKTDLNLATGKSDVLAGTDMNLKSGSSGGTGALGNRTSDLSIGSSDLDLHVDSGLALAEDDELVIGGSSVGSDVTLGSDSGINLSSPTDSGLSLEDEPLDLAGSSAISSLELPEDEDVLSLDETLAEDSIKQDEEFLLSPSGETYDDADSGSQVIALEESGSAFDLGAAGMAGMGAAGAGAGLLATDDMLGGAMPTDAGFPTQGPMPVPMGVQMARGSAEADYTALQLVGLFSVLFMLALCGMMMTDVVRHMWSFDDSSPAVSSFAEGISKIFK